MGRGTTVETIFSTPGLQHPVGRVAFLPLHYSTFYHRLSRPGFIDVVYVTTPLPRADGTVGLREIVDIIIGTILKRRAMGKEYGLVVLAEGLIEAIGATWLKEGMEYLAKALKYNSTEHYGSFELDMDHNHLRLGEIEFARMIKDALKVRGPDFNIDTTYVDKDLGYELRCADPIPFDVEYTRNLGYSAVKYLLSDNPEDGDGAIISFAVWQLLFHISRA